MKKTLTIIAIILAIFSSHLFAQNESSIQCGTDVQLQKEFEIDPTLQTKRQHYEKAYQKHMQALPTNPEQRRGVVYTIPLVVHIIHDGDPLGTDENPTDATIASIIDEASQRFRQTLTTSTYTNPLYGVDTEIDFCLATTDPDGNFTTGITRHYDPPNAIGPLGTLLSTLSVYNWDTQKYCNLYIVNDLTDAAGVYGSLLDGTIYNASSFWSGLIAHEIGHYFSLGHTFNTENSGACPSNSNCLSSGDNVCDTPPKPTAGYNGGSCGDPANSCATDEADTSTNNPYRPTSMGGMGDQPDMLENYMDYTGGCWDAFTQGQKDRMHFNITNFRSALSTSSAVACAAQPTPNFNIGTTLITPNNTACSPSFAPDITIRNYGAATLTNCQIMVYIDNVLQHTENWTGSLASGMSTTVTMPTMTVSTGVHTIRATTNNPNGNTDANIYDDEAYANVSYSGTGSSLPFDEDFDACAISADWTYSEWQFSSYLNECPDCITYLVEFNSDPFPYNLTMPLMDFTGMASPQLTFSFGHIPRYSFIPNDELRIEVSVNCGPPTIVYQKSGLDKATNNPPAYSDGAYLFPSCTEFRTEVVDLSAFANMGQVQINFIADGEWWSPIVLDDILIENTSSCQPNLTLAGPIAGGTYQVMDYIICTGTISSPASVTLNCNDEIQLNGGFEVQLGAELCADPRSTGCN